MIGHWLGAAGGSEAIATIKAITTGWLHPSINQFVSFSGQADLLLEVGYTLSFCCLSIVSALLKL